MNPAYILLGLLVLFGGVQLWYFWHDVRSELVRAEEHPVVGKDPEAPSTAPRSHLQRYGQLIREQLPPPSASPPSADDRFASLMSGRGMGPDPAPSTIEGTRETGLKVIAVVVAIAATIAQVVPDSDLPWVVVGPLLIIALVLYFAAAIKEERDAKHASRSPD